MLITSSSGCGLKTITRFATGGLRPDLTILLDLEAEAGLRRRKAGGEWNRLDAYDLEFHRRVRAGYLQLAAAEPERWAVVPAEMDVEALAERVWSAVSARLRVEDESRR